MNFKLTMISLAMCIMISGCQPSQRADYTPERLPPIPESAEWAGGVDGGAWLECWLDEEQGANWCTAWDDQTGAVVVRTFFVLRETRHPVSEEDLNYSHFSGNYIGLSDGRVLEPVKAGVEGQQLWAPPPIDPPRARP